MAWDAVTGRDDPIDGMPGFKIVGHTPYNPYVSVPFPTRTEDDNRKTIGRQSGNKLHIQFYLVILAVVTMW
jgi:hypothetical protein